jgi:Raf kinase inhibitor-like YbhB/YbcL family protein
MRLMLAGLTATLALLTAACGDDGNGGPRTATAAAGGAVTAPPTDFTLRSDAFPDGATIPLKYTCSGNNVSVPLSWSGAPAGTKAFALVMDDPDAPIAGGFVHWVAYDIPANVSALPEGVPEGDAVAGGGTQGANGRGTRAYTGPCPPAGAPHHYYFRLFALDAPLGLPAGAARADVEAAMRGHVLGGATLVGVFGR